MQVVELGEQLNAQKRLSEEADGRSKLQHEKLGQLNQELAVVNSQLRAKLTSALALLRVFQHREDLAKASRHGADSTHSATSLLSENPNARDDAPEKTETSNTHSHTSPASDATGCNVNDAGGVVHDKIRSSVGEVLNAARVSASSGATETRNGTDNDVPYCERANQATERSPPADSRTTDSMETAQPREMHPNIRSTGSASVTASVTVRDVRDGCILVDTTNTRTPHVVSASFKHEHQHTVGPLNIQKMINNGV